MLHIACVQTGGLLYMQGSLNTWLSHFVSLQPIEG